MSRLNDKELAMMQSPIRAWSQRHVEMRVFRRLLRKARVDPSGGRILDAGCGNGNGLVLLAEMFHPRRLCGFDLMPEQVERARARTEGTGAEVAVGDITAIDHPDDSFEAIFVFGILHHVPAWRDGLRELARVLAPGGALCVEELAGRYIAIQDRVIGTVHPPEARFAWPEFRGGLVEAGLTIAAEQSLVPGAARSFVAVKRRS